MTEKLKPCPFCGSEPWGTFGPDETGHFWIECCGPGDDCMTCGNWYGTNEYKSRDEVRAAWNRRATPAPAQPEDSRQALEAAALAIERKASKSLERFDFDRAWSAGMRKAAEIVRGLAAQPEGQKTGWPPGMLQDDDRKLSRALAGAPHARAHADEAAAAIKEMERIRFAAPTSPTPAQEGKP